MHMPVVLSAQLPPYAKGPAGPEELTESAGLTYLSELPGTQPSPQALETMVMPI